MGWWIAEYYQSGAIVELVSQAFWVIFSITLHELAHGWVALWQGDDTPRRLGRMTANPLVHMGGMSLIVFAIIGIAWGVMPTDPSRYRWRRKGRIIVAGAGPAMNLLLTLASLTALVAWLAAGPRDQALYRNLTVFLWTGVWLNVLLALFNLLPIPPLDGSQILSGLSLRMYRFFQQPQAQMFGLFVVLAIFLSGIGSVVFWRIQLACLRIVDLAGGWLDSPRLGQVLFG